MTYEKYLAIKGCYYQHVEPELNGTGVNVYCLCGVDTNKTEYTEFSKCCVICNPDECKNRVEMGTYMRYPPLKRTSNVTAENVVHATDSAICYWAYLYWRDELTYFERTLVKAREEYDDEQIAFCLNSISEAKQLIVEIYNKLIKMPEIEVGLISKPEWLDD